MTDPNIIAALARIEQQGRSTHHRLDEYRADLVRHIKHDDERFEKVDGRITKGAIKQGWLVGIGVGAIAALSWIKDYLTF
jgi:hypothetical protein